VVLTDERRHCPFCQRFGYISSQIHGSAPLETPHHPSLIRALRSPYREG